MHQRLYLSNESNVLIPKKAAKLLKTQVGFHAGWLHVLGHDMASTNAGYNDNEFFASQQWHN